MFTNSRPCYGYPGLHGEILFQKTDGNDGEEDDDDDDDDDDNDDGNDGNNNLEGAGTVSK